MLPPRCQNPDCRRGNKQRRPTFAPPLRSSRGHGPGARIRAYQRVGDLTIEDPTEQATDADYPDQAQRLFDKLSPRQQAYVRLEVAWLEGLGPKPSGRMPRR
jgi:hypothetical protein